MVNFSIFDSATSELFHAISILVELRLYYGKFAFFSLNFGCTMVNLKRFSKIGHANGLYYGENGSSRF